ncbi:MAG: GGDEF domain-containing protein [Sulfurimonas sp.]
MHRYKTHAVKLPYKITALLYIIVLVIPLGFYSTYHSFDTIKEDSKVLQQSGWMQGLLPYISTSDTPLDQRSIDRAEKILDSYAIWIEKNRNSEHYIGAQTLQKDLQDVWTCWRAVKQKQSALSPACATQLKALSITIQEIVKSKQKKTVNLFYISLSLTMLVVLFSIYMLRLYMRYQLKKHAIHDEETGLFNQKYFDAELHILRARSVRHDYPLSLLFISLDGFERKNYNKQTQNMLFKMIGEVFSKTVRESDVGCRYSENGFAILMPFTTEESAELFEKRIKEALQAKHINVEPKFSLRYATIEYDGKESDQEFIQRAQDALEA